MEKISKFEIGDHLYDVLKKTAFLVSAVDAASNASLKTGDYGALLGVYGSVDGLGIILYEILEELSAIHEALTDDSGKVKPSAKVAGDE